MLILLSSLSFSVKMTVSPTAILAARRREAAALKIQCEAARRVRRPGSAARRPEAVAGAAGHRRVNRNDALDRQRRVRHRISELVAANT
jgi:hypothetical protein